MANTPPSSTPGIRAIHATSREGANLVFLGNLRVLITKHEDGWIAQGLEIDYAIDGATVDEVKARFEDGLTLTVRSHLRVHNGIKQLFKNAPQEYWDKFYAVVPPDQQHEATVTVHTLPRELQSALSFDQIIYARAA
jgi:hypothetical protein